MNNRNLNFKFPNTIVLGWSILTFTFLMLFFFALVWLVEGRLFFLIVNLINIFLFICFILFKKNIEKLILIIIGKSANINFNFQYDYEIPIGIALLSLIIAFSFYVIIVSISDVRSYSTLIREDGIVEYTSSIAWIISAVFMGLHSIQIFKKTKQLRQIIFSLLFIFFFVICAGEEVSWGQRIFDIETPEFLKSINVQNETTLHNIGSISIFSNIFFLMTITFFLIIPFFVKKNSFINQTVCYINFPVPNRFAITVYILSILVWVYVGIRFGTLGFHPYSFYIEKYYTQMDDEIFEFLAAYSFMCFSIFNYFKRISLFFYRS